MEWFCLKSLRASPPYWFTFSTLLHYLLRLTALPSPPYCITFSTLLYYLLITSVSSPIVPLLVFSLSVFSCLLGEVRLVSNLSVSSGPGRGSNSSL
ncbi:unnamed protein product [Arctogadus glacialis]